MEHDFRLLTFSRYKVLFPMYKAIISYLSLNFLSSFVSWVFDQLFSAIDAKYWNNCFLSLSDS